jgi:hypothetical protein
LFWNLRADLHEKARRLVKYAACWGFTDQNLTEISFPGTPIKAEIGL